MSQDKINPDYYSGKIISPVEFIVANNLGFIEGNIIKYVSRYKEKNGIEDLNKAKWYLDNLISLVEGMNNGNVTRSNYAAYVREWISSINNKINHKG